MRELLTGSQGTLRSLSIKEEACGRISELSSDGGFWIFPMVSLASLASRVGKQICICGDLK